MMGAAAVADGVGRAAVHTIFEDIRRYIQNHKGEWTGDNQDLR